jgi:hypothetical protein
MEPVAFGRFRWLTVAVPLASLAIRVDDLAARLNFPIHIWDQEGLGPTRGLAGRLPSGRPFELQELQHAIQYQGAKGPNVLVDAEDLKAQGVESLLQELLRAMHLSRSDVTWVLDSAGEEQAARWLRDFRERSSGD